MDKRELGTAEDGEDPCLKRLSLDYDRSRDRGQTFTYPDVEGLCILRIAVAVLRSTGSENMRWRLNLFGNVDSD